jgi:acyl carrier protein
MGLDSVELVMRIEEEFSIDLPDDEISGVRTVGDLYEVVLSKLKTSPDCLSSKAFYRIRKALVEVLEVPRRSIRPAGRLEPLFPLEQRKRLWKEFSDVIELTIPRLQYPKVWKGRFIQISMILSTVIVISTGIALHIFLGLSIERLMAGHFYWACAVIFWIFLATTSDLVLRRRMTFLRTEIPVVAVGDLTRMVLALNPSVFSSEAQDERPLSKDQIWIKLVQIFCDQLQLDPDEIVPDATIIEDLGVC